MHSKTRLLEIRTLICMLFLLPSIAWAQDDERATVGEWIALLVILAGLVNVLVIAPVLWRRDANPHTGLPSKIKRRRGRGPLSKMK
jgi:uncharacterized protein YjeT (DUF2065 family)